MNILKTFKKLLINHYFKCTSCVMLYRICVRQLSVGLFRFFNTPVFDHTYYGMALSVRSSVRL